MTFRMDGKRYEIIGDRFGGIELISKEDGRSVYFQPGDDAMHFRESAGIGEDAVSELDEFQEHALSEYESVLEAMSDPSPSP